MGSGALFDEIFGYTNGRQGQENKYALLLDSILCDLAHPHTSLLKNGPMDTILPNATKKVSPVTLPFAS